MKRDLYLRRGCLRMISCATQEPFVCDEKRRIFMKETYIYEKRPIYTTWLFAYDLMCYTRALCM